MPMDLTWGNQTFDRTSDTLTLFRVSPEETKKVASTYFNQVTKPINYPAHCQGSQLYGTFRHGKFSTEDGEYLLVRNVGTLRGTSIRYGAVIVRTRTKGSLIQIDAKVSNDYRSVHEETVPVATLRGDLVGMQEAIDLGILEKFTKEAKWKIFDQDSIAKSFNVSVTRMSDQTNTPTIQTFKTKKGTRSVAVSPKATRSVRVRKAK